MGKAYLTPTPAPARSRGEPGMGGDCSSVFRVFLTHTWWGGGVPDTVLLRTDTGGRAGAARLWNPEHRPLCRLLSL